MLWAGSKPRDLYLGTRVLAICDGADVLLSAPAQGFEAGVVQAQVHLANAPYTGHLRVWLSGGLCRPFLLPALPGVHGAAETLRVATKLASERTGLGSDCRVWLDAPRLGEARVAVAVAQATLDRVKQGLGTRWRIESIQPWWAEVLQLALARKLRPVAVGVQDCDSLTVLIGREGGFSVATTISPLLDEAAADSAFTRTLMSANVERDEALRARLVVAGSPPGAALCSLGSLMEISP